MGLVKGLIGLLIVSISLFGLATGCNKSAPKAHAQSTSSESTSSESIPSNNEYKILVVHSYYTDYEWVNAVSRGIRMVFNPNQHQLEIIYMDTKRQTDENWKLQKAAEMLSVIDEWKPDVVITVDDNAQQYVGRRLAGRTSPSVVFCGVNQSPEQYGYPAENVTGVLERLHYAQTIDFLKKILPNVQKIALISDDSLTSRGVLQHVKQEEGLSDVELVCMLMPQTFNQWKHAVADFSAEVDAIAVYTYHTVRTAPEDFQSIPPEAVINWTIENSAVPVLGFLPFAVSDGSFCGVLESGTEQGQLAGKLALKILAGRPASSLPIITGTRGQTMINLRTARKYDIQVDEQFLRTIDLVIGE